MTDIHCSKCGRYLGSFEQSSITVTLKCPNCRSLNRYHMVSLSKYDPERSDHE